jgi:putative ABC transport system permease protein
MVVGAASTRASATASLEAQFPTDLVVDSYDGRLPASLPGTLAAIDGVVASSTLLAGEITGPDGQPVWTLGVDSAEAAGVLRSSDEVALPESGQALVPEWLAQTWAVADGDSVSLTGPGTTVDATVLVVDEGPLMLPVAGLRQLLPDAGIGQLWLRLSQADPDAQIDVVDRVTDVVAEVDPSAAVTGVVTLRDQINEVLDVLLLVVTGLLGIAVVIALIGVGNTLALSVVERRQENGLLRALGLTRGQLRALLAWEALLVAGVAAVLGVTLGGAYGLIGAASVLGGIGEVVLVVPWLQVVAIVAVATLAGLLASVLPARRAARTSPVAAIAA